MPETPLQPSTDTTPVVKAAPAPAVSYGELKILLVTQDSTLFEEGSLSRARMLEYGALVNQLHVIVLCRIGHGFRITKISPNVWLYPTNSIFKALYPLDALRISYFQITWKHRLQANLISAEDPFETGLCAWLIARRNKKRLHIKVENDFLDPHYVEEGVRAELKMYLAKYVVTKALRIQAASQKIKQSLETMLFIPHDRISVLAPYVDINRIMAEPIKNDLRTRYGSGFIILMNTRLSKEKNIPLAISVMERIVRMYPKTTLVIVGSGHQRGRLMSLVHKAGLSHNVFFESKAQDLISYYKSAHVNLITSDYEDHGAPIIEALAASCPVVATYTPVSTSIFGSLKYSHYLCPAGDGDCLTARVKELMEVTGARDDFKINAKYIVQDLLPYTKEQYLQAVKKDWLLCFGIEDGRGIMEA